MHRSVRWLAALLAAATLAALIGGATAASSSAQPNVDFDYLVLARTWPPTLCSLDKCSQPTYNLFTIHGLWPSNYNGNHPDRCDPAWRFNKNELSPAMRGRMSCEWRNFKSGDLNSFWSYEWSKHGTCAAPLFGNSQAEYFNSTLRLNEQYDLNEALTRGGFNPLSANQATAGQIAALLKQQWGVTPGITCNSGKIYEVKTCFNVQLKPIDCPGGSGCPRTAQSLPYGGPIPQACQSYIDNVPATGSSGKGAASPPPPGSAAARPAAASTAGAALLLLAALATALLAF